jgi:5-methylthioadenosine/S-adenosylhomocysteine deaminase
MAGRTLLRGGHIISMDPDIGDIPGGDVLIEGEDIAAVAPSIDASDCEVVDASGAIIIPGFIDSHRHTWETVVRGIAPDVTLDGYFALVLDRLRRPIARRTSTPATSSARLRRSTLA